jgi:lysophospholipase L1-like esterase
MKLSSTLSIGFSCLAFGDPTSLKPPFFLLAGDSTTATQSSNGGGWGDGFLNKTLSRGAKGQNFGHNGATTVSFRAGGDWSDVLEAAQQVRDDYCPFVTIQFGHNDQKSSANISLSEFTKNLVDFVVEAREAGAEPILVTPLSRRNYENSTMGPEIIHDLANVTNATIQAAHESGAYYINLNKQSTRYLNAIGPVDAYTYNLNDADHTHLNVEGSVVFGSIVADLIKREIPAMKKAGFIHVDREILVDVEKGIYYWP